MMQRLAVQGKPAGAIGHKALPLRTANGRAQIGLARCTWLALAAFGDIKRDNMIAGLEACDTRADFLNDARTLMPEHDRQW